MFELGGTVLGTPFQGGILVTLILILGVNVRAWIAGAPDRAKVAVEREANLLNERAEEMIGMRERLAAVEAKLEQKDRLLEAERTMYRHRIANLGQAFTALLMLLRKGVAVDDAVAEIERMRAEQLDREVAEAAMFRAAGVNPDIADPKKSDALNAAEQTKRATERADDSAGAACEEVRRAEDDGK